MTDTAAAGRGGNSLHGRSALITGAGRGLGRAAALRLAREGAHIIALARTAGALEELDDTIRREGGDCTLVPLDLRDGEAIDALGRALFERFDKLDILVAAAGLLGVLGPLGHIDPKVWAEVMTVNATAAYRLIRSLDPLLRRSENGRAIFVSDAATAQPRPYWGPYAASKAAMEAAALAWAAEIGGVTGIQANVVRFGPVATALRARAFPGEDPKTLPLPEQLTDIFVNLAVGAPRRHGEIITLPLNVSG